MWRFSETPGLLALLAKALVRTMADAGCRECGRFVSEDNSSDGSTVADDNSFLEHDITAHRRFVHVFRDLEYALQVGEE